MKTLIFVCIVCVSVIAEDDLESVSDSMKHFSEKFFLEIIRDNDGNILYSPLSLHSTLTLLTLGSLPHSKTYEELQKLVAYYTRRDISTNGYRDLTDFYKKEKNLKYGNHIWVSKDYTLSANYSEDVSSLQTEVDSINFAEAGAVDRINSWVQYLTNNRIPQLLSEVDPLAGLVLANAIYMDQKWTQPFVRMDRPIRFHKTDGSLVEVPGMAREDKDIKYGRFVFDDQFPAEFIRIPYENSNLEFQMIVPGRSFGIPEGQIILNFQEFLGLKRDRDQGFTIFKHIQDNVTYTKLDISLRMPSFKSEAKFNAVQMLKNLGVKEVFTGESRLDLMIEEETQPLTVSQIVQKAYISVDLNGTEAAVASFAEIIPLSIDPSLPLVVTVDRPFLYMVYDTVNDLPLMMGRMMDPLQQ